VLQQTGIHTSTVNNTQHQMYDMCEFSMVLTFHVGLKCCGYVTFMVSYRLILLVSSHCGHYSVRVIGAFDQRVVAEHF